MVQRKYEEYLKYNIAYQMGKSLRKLEKEKNGPKKV